MECNKEEATRAKDLAEIKLQEADFIGAKRMALKAHQLFPGLENISQLLAVCDVHCCASVKINGETDWYRILQVESTADEMVIKKQYRKLALLLHPDKNKLTGAEGAFKIIGEANMTLTDHVKRSLHDKKRKSVFKTSFPSPKKRGRPQKKTDPVAQWVNKENINAAGRQNKRQQQEGSFAGYSTFWTICLACGTKYNYPCSLLMKILLCQICSRSFVAYDLSKKPDHVQGETSHPWTGLGMQQKFPHSQQVHVTNRQQKYQCVPGWQIPFTRHQSYASHQKQSPSDPDRQPPAASQQQQQSQKPPFSAESFNVVNSQAAGDPNKKGTVGNNVTSEAGTCNTTKVSFAAFREGHCADKTEPLVNADQIRQENMHKRGSKLSPGSSYPVSMDGSHGTQKDTVVSEDKTAGQFPRSSNDQGNNVIGENDVDCRKGSDLPDSHVEKQKREGYSSCNSGKSGEIINEVTSAYCQQRGNIPSTGKTPNETGEVVNGLDHDGRERMGKSAGIPPSSATDDTFGSVDNNIPCKVTVSCPDSDFYNFEKNRDADEFTVDQVWAIYDDHDGMPRYYARIKQVYSPNFMLRFTWLEHDPLNDAEKAWSSKELPVACGSFRIGRTILTEDINMFSHVVSWAKGRKRNSYEIYPRKGEVWALFDGWDINWSSDSNDHKDFSYDIVEVKSDFAVSTGTYVIPLVKVKGFVSLFVQSSKEPYLIPGNDILRFSHSIPFHRLAEKDSKHIPHGALELDTASLPSKLEEAFSSVDLGNSFIRTQAGYTGCSVSPTGYSCKGEMSAGKSKLGPNVAATDEENVSNGVRKSNPNAGCDKWDDSSQPESPTSFEYPNPEFCNFTEKRSFNNFKNGQIWALYSDADMFPKYYGFIKKVDPDDCTIHIRWLEYCPCLDMEKSLLQEGLPVSCGTFEVNRQTDTYDSTSVFSHMMEVTPISKGKKYEIMPRVGQVWAIYKNWSRGWSIKDVKNCEYGLVEVLGIAHSYITVSCLTKVDGFSTLFMPESAGESGSAMEILRSDMTMFCHQIPAYRLTNEDDKLRGYLELDPASVPANVMFRKSN